MKPLSEKEARKVSDGISCAGWEAKDSSLGALLRKDWELCRKLVKKYAPKIKPRNRVWF